MKHRTLVVEDDPAIVHLVTDALVSMGHEFDIASCQQEALGWLAKQQYSYILLDIQIQSQAQNGVARIQNTENMLERVIEGSGQNVPPIILLSDYEVAGLEATVKVMRLAMALGRRGAMDIIGKPFPTAGRTLDRVIKKVLRIRDAMERQQAAGAPTVLGSQAGCAKAAVVPSGDEGNGDWLTVTAAAELLMHDLPGMNMAKARSRISTAAGRNEFRASGSHRDRRIEPHTFASWRLKQRDRDLDEADEEEEAA